MGVVLGVTIYDKGDTRRGGEMYLPTTKVRASLRMKGMKVLRERFYVRLFCRANKGNIE